MSNVDLSYMKSFTAGDWAVWRASINARTDLTPQQKTQLVQTANQAEQENRQQEVDLSWMNTMTEFERNTLVQRTQTSEQEKFRRAEQIAAGNRGTVTGTVEQRNALERMKADLGKYGLGSLAQPLWDFIVAEGKPSDSQMWQWLESRPEFAQRFPAYKTLQDKKRAITPTEYIQLEQYYAQTMRHAGLPLSFFDDATDFTKLIENEVSPKEFQERIESGYRRVAQTNPQVRQAFKRYFGIDGDSALAAFFIDAERSAPALARMVQTAEIAGAMAQQQVNINLDYATRLAEFGVDSQKASEAARRLTSSQALYQAGVNEADLLSIYKSRGETAVPENMTNELVALEAFTGTSGAAETALSQSISQRRAAGTGERSGGVVTRTGRTSLG